MRSTHKNFYSSFAVLLAALFLFTACSGTSVVFTGLRVGSVSSQTDSSVYLSCIEFNGSATYTIHVREEHQRRLITELQVEEGTLSITVDDGVDGTSTAYFSMVFEQDDSFSIELPEYGRYRIVIQADAFHGSYSFSWAM